MTELTAPLLGPLAWIDIALLVWFAITAGCVAYVAWDSFRHNPDLAVMKWGWVLITLYTGVFGAGLYVLSAKEPRPNTHEEFVRPLWKQGVGSTIHCVAGDATGIILAATVTALIGFPMGLDLAIEYAFGFAFGLFIFQALFMQAREPGRWLLHCHINHHTTNDNTEDQGGGGLMLVIEVS